MQIIVTRQWHLFLYFRGCSLVIIVISKKAYITRVRMSSPNQTTNMVPTPPRKTPKNNREEDARLLNGAKHSRDIKHFVILYPKVSSCSLSFYPRATALFYIMLNRYTPPSSCAPSAAASVPACSSDSD